ncbi:MAG: hypothetical protein KME07_02985 [Pegethrix bostrychoides GSE-TBD4-15B]|jgi:chromosome segregation ATPase|uniref:Uncharacterized protein n=1 Tax=Pegethrix bostrychoides GSE-TBD4-15B TaxID=2839662 RepID=A0A951P766_9CYAN|nr:hypothetical protein [Pegethrix bostrychoides GSE-TBD4-15B]
MQLANPLYYPLPVFVGAITLVAGIRLVNLPSFVVLPVAGAVAMGGAAFRKSQAPPSLNLNNPALEADLLRLQQQAQTLTLKAEELRLEAARLLTQSTQMDLLAAVQLTCDQVQELPTKIAQLVQQMQGQDSLLSVQDLQRQLANLEAKLPSSVGVMQSQLIQLAASLRQNIQLAQEGQDARQAQAASLSKLVLDSAGQLQKLQNHLRTADLANAQQTTELRTLSDELSSVQTSLDLLIER